MLLSYSMKFRRKIILNSFKFSCLDFKFRTGFYNTWHVTSTNHQGSICCCNRYSKIFFPRKFKRFLCVLYAYDAFFSSLILGFLHSNMIDFDSCGLDQNNCRFSLDDLSMKCSVLTLHGVLKHRRRMDVTVVMQKICSGSRLFLSDFQWLIKCYYFVSLGSFTVFFGIK